MVIASIQPFCRAVGEGEMGFDSELSLDFNLCNRPNSIGGFMKEVSVIADPSKRLLKLQELLECLEEERKKIDAFKRELPFCMLLMNEAIESIKGEENQCRSLADKSTSVKEDASSATLKLDEATIMERVTDSRDKMNWMSSVQLWSNCNDKSDKIKSSIDLKEKADESEPQNQFLGCKSISKCNGGAFLPFKMVSDLPAKIEERALQRTPDLSLLSPGIKNLSANSGIEASNRSSAAAMSSQSNLQQLPRKQRRCWSPELHRRFLNALNELGGSQTATPKQIRELMKVDGLTNDEVKSHLQKYRLHTRRLPASAAASTNKHAAAMGGVWVPHGQHQGSKIIAARSGSPQGPLQLSGTLRGISTALSREDDDGKSDSYSWKSQLGSGEETE